VNLPPDSNCGNTLPHGYCPPLRRNRLDRRILNGRSFPHNRRCAAGREEFAREFAGFLRRALPPETVIQLFFGLCKFFSGKEN
jgi:hypothetical protein